MCISIYCFSGSLNNFICVQICCLSFILSFRFAFFFFALIVSNGSADCLFDCINLYMQNVGTLKIKNFPLFAGFAMLFLAHDLVHFRLRCHGDPLKPNEKKQQKKPQRYARWIAFRLFPKITINFWLIPLRCLIKSLFV